MTLELPASADHKVEVSLLITDCSHNMAGLDWGEHQSFAGRLQLGQKAVAVRAAGEHDAVGA